MKNIQWLFFDIGSTLVDEKLIWKDRIEGALKVALEEGVNITYNDVYKALENAASNYQVQAKTAAKTLGISRLGDYNPDCEYLFDDVISTLEKLKTKYHLGVIANQCEDLTGRLKKLGIAHFFDLIVSSNDVKLVKPDERIFKLALEQSKCQPQHAVMIGDRLDNDIAPAKKLGFKTIRIMQGISAIQKPKNANYTPDYTITNIKELLDIFNL